MIDSEKNVSSSYSQEDKHICCVWQSTVMYYSALNFD